MSEAIFLPRGAALRRLPGGMSWSGALSLLAIMAVLVVISAPRLRGLAQQENEADACGTAQILARALRAQAESGTRVPTLRELLRRPELSGTLADAEIVAQGRLLRRHGYLFEVTRLPPDLSLFSTPVALLSGQKRTLDGLLAIRAWPWSHGSTGRASYLVTVGGSSLQHANPGPLWQGLEAAGATLDEPAGWHPGR